MLMLKGGLGAIASGDVDALKETLSSIDKPFTGENEDYALLLFILGAVAFGLLLYLIMKKKKSTVFALILGLTYGYVLRAAVLSGDEHSRDPLCRCRSFSPPGKANRSHNKPKAGRINFWRPCPPRRASRS